MYNVRVVGAPDAQLEGLLRAAGASVRFVDAQSLTAKTLEHGGAVYLVDLRARAAVPSWLPAFRRQAPAVPVLVLLPSLEPALILEAMRAGVNECLPAPPEEKDVAAALERLCSQHLVAAGTTFAFVGTKGGVGTTTAAVNVATALSRRASTALVDLHLAHGDAAVLLGVEPRFSVVDALENVQRLDKAFFRGIVSKPKIGPDVLPSSDRAFVPQGVGHNMRHLVDFVSQTYSYTVLDVPRSDASALDALDAAKRIILVANQELSAVRSAARIAETLRQRYGSDRLALLICRYDPQAEIGQDDVEKVTGVRGAVVVPSDYRLALQALNAGRPFTAENHSRLSAAYRDLADRLVGAERPETPEPTSRLFGRLLGRKG